MNVKDYLARINYTGSLEPNLKTLTALTWAHKNSILFTNIEYVSKGGVEFDLEKIYQNVINEKKGGICYQLNRLYAWLLEQLGFHTSILMGSFMIDESKKFWSDWGGHNSVFVSICRFTILLFECVQFSSFIFQFFPIRRQRRDLLRSPSQAATCSIKNIYLQHITEDT